VTAVAVIGDVRTVSRFPGRDRFAAYNGTAPIEMSSGGRKVYRLSRRGNRRLNHAIHMVAVTQIRYRHSPGRGYYDKKLAEGKTPKEALRCLKRQISDAIFGCRQADARRAAAKSPGGQPGNHFASSAAGSHPEHRLFGQATPGPATHSMTPAGADAAAPFPGLAAIPREQAAGSRTGRSPAAQRRPQGVLDAPAREPIMPCGGKASTPGPGPPPPSTGPPGSAPHQRHPLDTETKRCSFWKAARSCSDRPASVQIGEIWRRRQAGAASLRHGHFMGRVLQDDSVADTEGIPPSADVTGQVSLE
jgi:hypothetical protein